MSPTHPDATRWDRKHRRFLERDTLPEAHTWLAPHLRSSPLNRVIEYACGLTRVPESIDGDRQHYTGLDISMVSLSDSRKRYWDGYQTAFARADLEQTFPVTDEFPAIHVVTYFYSPYLWKQIARSRGEVLVETFCAEGDGPVSDRYCLDPGELPGYFPKPWEILLYQECPESHPETARLHARRVE